MSIKFSIKKVKANTKLYEVITCQYNMYIFRHKNSIYAYNYATNMFYELEPKKYIQNKVGSSICYSIKKRLNHDRLMTFTSYNFRVNPINGELENVLKQVIDFTELRYCD